MTVTPCHKSSDLLLPPMMEILMRKDSFEWTGVERHFQMASSQQ